MAFLPGLTLAGRHHDEVVAPILRRRCPHLPYAAGLLDGGSELLGLHTVRSTDHDWGPRLQLFVPAAEVARAPALRAALDADLPVDFLGCPTRFVGEDGRLGVSDPAGSRHGRPVRAQRRCPHRRGAGAPHRRQRLTFPTRWSGNAEVPRTVSAVGGRATAPTADPTMLVVPAVHQRQNTPA
ncbi:hypothetical protein HNR22_000704 [Micromonospora jinlongensis]|uniref:Uncharacterized protein n=1 Tax=Micromonospora jinlongensis TaxID=1287877 RepID=A0A7Z0BD63_9ACTN|nr:hypothetical protein [Micromonospora jinlongensis]NYH40977.1 hypothetical protein [Micromonospora jinlongensis]